jgi:hypothetical protein
VSASFASLGDVIIAEPRAQIGFAGPRVIRETINQELPEGFQTAEFVQECGFVDRIVSRTRMRSEIHRILTFLCPSNAEKTVSGDPDDGGSTDTGTRAQSGTPSQETAPSAPPAAIRSTRRDKEASTSSEIGLHGSA